MNIQPFFSYPFHTPFIPLSYPFHTPFNTLTTIVYYSDYSLLFQQLSIISMILDNLANKFGIWWWGIWMICVILHGFKNFSDKFLYMIGVISVMGSVEILILVITFFGKPVFYMNATPYQTVDKCMESGKILKLPEEVEPSWYCEWVEKSPDAMPDLEGVVWTSEELAIINELNKRYE